MKLFSYVPAAAVPNARARSVDWRSPMSVGPDRYHCDSPLPFP